MKRINCINLCELISSVFREDSTFVRPYEEIKEMANFDRCERIYFGSSFCGQQFLHISDKVLSSFFEFCRNEKIKVTMVIPTFSQGDLAAGKKKVEKLLIVNGDLIDEVTVNDYGMLHYVKKFDSVKKNLGRLFMKDYRDPRYEEYFRMEWKPKIFTEYLSNLIKEYDVTGLEFDPTHNKVDYTDCPEGVEIGVHLPYCYVTVGRICEYASIPEQIEKKYRPNHPCVMECKENIVKYHTEDDREWIRFGRTIYFDNESFQVTGKDVFRVIYFPLDWMCRLVENQQNDERRRTS